MEAYDDLVQFARDCMRHARTASSKEVADERERTAREYQEKAAKLMAATTDIDAGNHLYSGAQEEELR